MRAIVALRTAEADDEPFLFELYCSTRQDELDAWGWARAQREAFLQMQYRAQRAHYATRYPAAEQQIISLGGRPIGRLMVERKPGEMWLVDIALLPEYRNAGIGTLLIEGVLAEAMGSGIPVRLHVLSTNPARRLYARLGFSVIGNDGVYLLMEKVSTGGM